MKNLFRCPFALLVLLVSMASPFSLLAQPADAPAPPGVAVADSVPAVGTAPREIWLTFGLDRVPWLQYRPIADIPLWQYLASLIFIFLAFLISKLLDGVIRVRVERWAARTTTKVDDLLVTLVRGPVKVVSFVIFLHIGMKVFSWPQTVASVLSAVLKVIIAGSITYVLLKTIDALMGLWRERRSSLENEQFSKQLLPLIGKSLKVFIVVVAVLVTSQNLGLNVTGLIASLSIGGLAIGLAAQDTLGNLFGAVAVLMDQPFKVGDRVQLEHIDGMVEAIGFRSTRVRNLDGHLVTVPNKTMGNAIITNISERPNIKNVMNIGLTYETSSETVQRAVAILEEIYRAHPMTEDFILSFDKFNDSSLNLLVVYWWKGTDFRKFLEGMHGMNLSIKRRFNEAGIDFAFPTQTVYLKGELPEPGARDRGALAA